MLEVFQLGFSYGEKAVLNNINLEIEKGEITALIGPNGSGKSTLLRCMSGILAPQSGKIKLEGKNIKSYRRKEIAHYIALLPQNLETVNHISVRDLVARGRGPHQTLGWSESSKDRDKIAWALEYMDLIHMQDRPLNKLSGGERQRAWIAMVIAQDTDYILLDEPVNNLDIKYQWDLLSNISKMRDELNKTVIMVLHDINHALKVADRVYVLKDGAIYQQGGTEEIITSSLIKDVYGVCAHICHFPGCCRPVIVPVA